MSASVPLAFLLASGRLPAASLLWTAVGGAAAVILARRNRPGSDGGASISVSAAFAIGARAGAVAFAFFVAATPILIALYGGATDAALRTRHAPIGATAALLLGSLALGGTVALLCAAGGALAATVLRPRLAPGHAGNATLLETAHAAVWHDPQTEPARAGSSGSARYGRRFTALFGIGLAGIATLPLVLSDLARGRALTPAQTALGLVNPVLLVVVAVIVGLRFAPGVPVRSRIAEWAAGDRDPWRGLTREAGEAVLLAALLALAVAGIAALASRFGDAAVRALDGDPTVPAGTMARRLLSGVLYGGVTEELMLRWGLLPVTAVGVQHVVRFVRGPSDHRAHAAATPRVMHVAIVLTALLFGVAHLPAASSITILTGVVVARTVVLNAAAGVVFGWLAWKRSLEAAMVAHAAAHVVFVAVALAEYVLRR